MIIQDQYLLDKYNSGARFVLIRQSLHIDDMVFYETVENTFQAPWASGLYELLADGTRGECLSYNFDSSD
jgi:hypothetical protein